MFPTLEELYRWLMFAYPTDYRRLREDEIVGTLLEAGRPGQRVPGPREAFGLILGGVRTRAWLSRTGGVPGEWADSLRLAAALLIAFNAMQAIPGFFFYQTIRPHLLPIGLVVTALVLLRGVGRWGVALVAMDLFLVAPSLSISPPWQGPPLWVATLLPLMAAAAAFAWSPARPPHRAAWPWWFAAVVGAGPALLQVGAFHGGYSVPPPSNPLLLEAMPAAAVTAAALMAATLVTADPRPALGGAIYLGATALSIMVTPLTWLFVSPLAVVTAWQGEAGAVITLMLAAACLGVGRLSSRLARRF